MIHTTSESDITSLATSSPRSSPKPPQQAYYVQSPSRDSHEEDKSSTSAASATATRTTTPSGCRSPSASPSLLSLFGRHSRSSSASRVSGPRHGFRRGKGRRDREKRHLLGHVTEGDEEEGRAKDDGEIYIKWWKDGDEGGELSSCCKVLMSGMVLGLVFMLCCLVVWGASRPFDTQVFPKDMRINNFYFGEGSDLTGVPTKMLTVNCSLMMRVHNPATFFGIHVSSSIINLRYYDLNIANGQMEKFYQPRKSWRTVNVNIQGNNVPLYGAGIGFVTSNNNAEGVPLILEFEVRSRGAVVGKLVKSKHRRRVRCSLTITSHSTENFKFVENSCIYR